MRRFTIRNDMVQRISTLIFCYLLALTLLSSHAFAEEKKGEEASEPPANENRRVGNTEHFMVVDGAQHRVPLRQRQRQQHRQHHTQHLPQQPQQHTQTVYIALEDTHHEGSHENQIQAQTPRHPPRAGPRRKRVRQRQRAPQSTHFYSPAVVQTPRYTQTPTQLYEMNSAHASTTDPKNYAFAYAVRDTDHYSGDDFSHKEARDGKLTMGEYKVVLPDGRTQIVRYTAGANQGFKADVTYEEDEPTVKPSGPRPRPTVSSYFSSPTSAVHNQYTAPPSHTAASPYKNPIYFSKPVKSPQIVFRSNNQYKNHLDNHVQVSATPSPNIVFKAGPSSRPFRLPPPSQATFINGLLS